MGNTMYGLLPVVDVKAVRLVADELPADEAPDVPLVPLPDDCEPPRDGLALLLSEPKDPADG